MAGRPSSRLILLVALVVLVLFLLPWLAGQYPIYLAIQILILAVFSLGFNLLFGYTGLLSFGQAGFFAVGAYGTLFFPVFELFFIFVIMAVVLLVRPQGLFTR